MTTRPLALAVLAIVLSASGLEAQGPFPDLWRWVHFTVADGLPSNFVTATVDIPGDAVWAVTRGGLARFDGYRWRAVPLPGGLTDRYPIVAPAKGGRAVVVSKYRVFSGRRGELEDVTSRVGPAVRIVSAVAGAGDKLFLLSDAGVLCDWSGISCVPHDLALGDGAVRTLLPAGRDRVWVSTDRGLASWNGTNWQPRLSAKQNAYALMSAFESEDGEAWAYVDRPFEARGLWHWPAGGGAPQRSIPPSPIIALTRTRSGHVLAAHWTGDLAVQEGTRWMPIATGSLVLDVRSLTTLLNDDLMLSTDQGVFLYRTSSNRWSIQTFPPPDDANSVNEIAMGPDGTLWLGTAGGMCRLGADGRLERLAEEGQERLRSVTGVVVDDRGQVWVSSGDAFEGVRRRSRNGWERLRLDPLLDRTYIHRIVRDRKGGFWFLGLSQEPLVGAALPRTGPGGFRLSPDGTVSRWGEAQGLLSGRVYAFQEAPDGSYWFGTALGLSRYHDGAWRHWTMAEGLRSARVFTLAVDARGTVWFGHQALGLGKLENGAISYVAPQEGLVGDAVWSVNADVHDRVWVATESGVSLLEAGRWTAFGARSGLPKARVWPVLPKADRVYMGTSGGGLAMLNLSNPAPAPIVTADRVAADADGAAVTWTPSAWWAEIPADAIPTRIRLDEGAWSEWTTRREHRYLGVAPGRHTVRLQAKGLLGTLGRESDRIPLTVAPPPLLRPIVYLPLVGLALIAASSLGLLAWRKRQHHLALHESEQRFRAVFRSSPLPAAITRFDDGICTDVNAALERLFGLSRAQLIGKTAIGLDLVVGGFDRKRLSLALRKDGMAYAVPFQIKRSPAGEVLDLLGYFQVFDLGGRRYVLAQVIDVTAQRRLELQLSQAQKMETVGRLAGGIAHDFNNLLTVILGNASLVEGALVEGDPRREEVEQIKTAAERAERLTRQLLAFARKQVVEPRVVNVNDVVLRTERMLHRLIGEDIDLVTLTGDVPAVLIDPGQLEQVLVNMAINARDAMPDGGRLTIATSSVVIGAGEAAVDPETLPGPYVRLSIADTGVGMDGATAARAFDPFFTTKEAGKGTGLGLAMCYGIVKQAGGQILVQTAPGGGTTFHVDLPRTGVEPAEAEVSDQPREAPGGRETLLLVEDEEQVRRLATAVLRRQGYEVLEAASGTEALAVAGGFAGRIDLLVTDVVMPHMRGTEVARALTAARPGLKVIYVSGYTDDEEFRKEAGADAFGFLAKPFTPGALARGVREVLDGGVE